MAKYIFIEGQKGSEWPQEFNTKEEAIKVADYSWNHREEADRQATEYAYILESVNPDEETPDHFDGDIIKIYKEC